MGSWFLPLPIFIMRYNVEHLHVYYVLLDGEIDNALRSTDLQAEADFIEYLHECFELDARQSNIRVVMPDKPLEFFRYKERGKLIILSNLPNGVWEPIRNADGFIIGYKPTKGSCIFEDYTVREFRMMLRQLSDHLARLVSDEDFSYKMKEIYPEHMSALVDLDLVEDTAVVTSTYPIINKNFIPESIWVQSMRKMQ